MSALLVEGRARLAGEVVLPPDKSITHRALIFAALAEGPSSITPVGRGRDNRATRAALEALGVRIREAQDGLEVHGAGGPLGLAAPGGPIDCMNSGTTLRVLAGVLAPSALQVELTGDESLSRRPMERLKVLEALGLELDGRRDGTRLYAPLQLRGARARGWSPPDQARTLRLPVASAQLKTAALLGALFTPGRTTIVEPLPSRDHSERWLGALGVDLGDACGALVVHGRPRAWSGTRFDVPPDLSSAAFLLAAAVLTGSRELALTTGANPSRSGFLEVLEAMGVELAREPLAPAGPEPVERVRVRRAALRGTEVCGARTLAAIDEIPLVACLAAFARGRTVIKDAQELRYKESDRLAQVHRLLTAFGARSTETADGLIIEGDGAPLHPAEVDGEGDHRIAMSAAVVGLALEGTTTVHGAEHIEVSYPGFARELTRLGAKVSERG